jgi:membrane-associated phospholipid phosphatase
MNPPAFTSESQPYLSQLVALAGRSVWQLARAPTAPYRTEAVQRLRRQSLALIAVGAGLIVMLMFTFDASEIAMMPPRGSPGLWPVVILTHFGKDTYVLAALGTAAITMAVAFPLLRGSSRSRLLRLGGYVEYLFLAVLVPVLASEVIKRVVGRGRPFVGGKADPFNFLPFHDAEPYFSFVSSHAVTAFALAFGVSAIWPRWRVPMFVYALAIGLSRLVLLAHHPSDVAGGAVLGLIGALGVRTWFATRQLCFAIEEKGKIVAR